jgi:hypothetical protein
MTTEATTTNEMVAGTADDAGAALLLGNQSGTPTMENLALHWRAGVRKLRALVSSSALGAALRLGMLRDYFVVRVMRLHVKYFVSVSASAKCPACGVRSKHKMSWQQLYASIIHTCTRCTAQWAEQPVVANKHWDVAAILAEPAPEPTVMKESK